MYQFFSVTLRNMRSVGTLWPSSKALSRALATTVARATGPKRVLEVGPGTGPVTRAILQALKPGDRFDLVELNPAFCATLARTVLDPWRAKHPKVEISLHACAIEEAPLPEAGFDHIVSCLPLNNFPADLVQRIMDRYMLLLKPHGTLSYFGYAGIRRVKGVIVGPKSRSNLRAISRIEDELLRRHRGQRQIVLPNFPPAYVHRVHKS